jgi:CelD/BcsL family acetyltransferase involved in cellulose biosynthesis
MQHKIIKSFDELDRLKDDWRDLLTRSYTNTFFQTHAWISTWVKHNLKEDELHLILVYEEKLIGIAPLYLKNETLRFIGDPLSDYSDFIIDKDYKKAALSLLHQEFCKIECNHIQLMEVPRESYSLQYFNGKAAISKIEDSYKFIEGDFEKIRAEIYKDNRRLKKNMRDGFFRSIEWKKEDLELVLPTFFRLHQQRWNPTPTKSIFNDETNRDFMTDLLKSNFELAHLSALKIDGDICSVDLSFHYEGTHYFYLPVYDTRFSYYSPGQASLLHIFGSDLQKDIRKFDLGRGQGEYKKKYANVESSNYEIEIPKKYKFVFGIKKKLINKLRKHPKLHRRLTEFQARFR